MLKMSYLGSKIADERYQDHMQKCFCSQNARQVECLCVVVLCSVRIYSEQYLYRAQRKSM